MAKLSDLQYRRMREAIAALPADIRDIFRLHLEGADYPSIAERLGIPVQGRASDRASHCRDL
jgi:DNA-directed RNA polymerase specialized sigma24 family protein